MKTSKPPLLFALILILTALPIAAQEAEPILDQSSENEEPSLRRTTVVPWSIEVLGKNFESFPNDEAAVVLRDWLINSLVDLKVLNVVNRDKIQAVLSEQQLVTSGYADDISPTALADAGKLLKVNYILFGNFKNLGKNSEIDFKLLDVTDATYSHSINFTIPFNSEIESMKPEIDRIVAALAVHFPIVAPLQQILDDRHLLLDIGAENGIREAMEAELWRVGSEAPVASGFVTLATAMQAEIELDRELPELNLFDFVARIKIVPPAQAALKKGLHDLEQGHFRKAAVTFRKGLEADPEDGLLHANYARSLWRSGDQRQAIESFRKALALRPDDVALLEDIAEALLESGNIEELIQVLEQDERMAYSMPLTLLLGQAHEILGYPERARTIYRTALRHDPDSAKTHLRLAILAAKQQKLEEADRELRQAQKSGVSSLEMELTLAAFAAVQSQTPNAKMALASLLSRAQEAGDIAALTSASEILLLHQPHWALSLELARQSLEVNPAYLRATIAAAKAYAAGGERAQAIALLNEALRTYPNSFALLFLSGQLLSTEKNFIEAESRFRRAQELTTEDWRPAEALGDIHTVGQDHLKAVRSYMDALERSDKQTASNPTSLLYKLGRASVQANQFDSARPYLERCVAGAPDHQECRYYLGLCYFKRATVEDDEKAIANFEAAGGLADSAHYLGVIHHRREAFPEALSWLRKCVDTSCPAAPESQQVIDLLESITGTVTAIHGKPQKVTLDIGRINGIAHGQEGFVVSSSGVLGRIRVEQVQDKGSVAEVLKGEPLVGQRVRFRPTSPKGVTVVPHPKKGVIVRWRSNREPEVELYEVQQRSSLRGSWKTSGKVKPPKFEYVDKSAKPGSTYYYKIVAVNEAATRSPASDVVHIAVR